MPGLTTEMIEKGINDVIAFIDGITDEMFREAYPSIMNENLKKALRAGFFIELYTAYRNREGL